MDDLEVERRQMLADAGVTQLAAVKLLNIARNSLVRWLKGGDQTAAAILRIDDRDYVVSIPIELGLTFARSDHPLPGQLRLPDREDMDEGS